MRSHFLLPLCLFFLILPTAVNAAFFKDVTTETKYKTAIDYLADKGIVSGYGDGTFGPENTLTRAELLKILLEAKTEFQQLAPPTTKCFPDVEISAWYAPYVCYAKDTGMVQGFPDGTFLPGSSSLADCLK